MPQLSPPLHIFPLSHTHPSPISPNTPLSIYISLFTHRSLSLSLYYVSTFSSLSISLLFHLSLTNLNYIYLISLLSLSPHLYSCISQISHIFICIYTYIYTHTHIYIYIYIYPALHSLTHHYPLFCITW